MSDDGLLTECRLDLDGVREQADRYGRLGAQATDVRRRPGSLAVRFGAQVDEALLRETIATEGSCCPFFRFEYSAAERRLTIGVTEPEQDAALDALVSALEGR